MENRFPVAEKVCVALSAYFRRLQRSIEIYERGYRRQKHAKQRDYFLFVLINYDSNRSSLQSQFIMESFLVFANSVGIHPNNLVFYSRLY